MKVSYKTIILTPLVALTTGCAQLNTVESVCVKSGTLDIKDSTTGTTRVAKVGNSKSLEHILPGDEVTVYAFGYKQNRVLEHATVIANRDSIAAREQAEKYAKAKELMLKSCPDCENDR